MTPKHEVGDLVRFKSGGPLMTIMDLRTDGTAECKFFHVDTFHREYFPLFALVTQE